MCVIIEGMSIICVIDINCVICIIASHRAIMHILSRVQRVLCWPNKQILYVIPICPVLGKLPLVPVGDTGNIPFSMRDELHEVDGASCDTKPGP